MITNFYCSISYWYDCMDKFSYFNSYTNNTSY
nr:MAG TPA: hypothetical protein [Caudoviricetes sp.]